VDRRDKPDKPGHDGGIECDQNLCRFAGLRALWIVTKADPEPDAERDAPISERDRTLTHLAILAVIVVLIGAGVWMANAILEMRRIQDCAMAGRRNCERITTPGRESWDVQPPSR
jgi:hypothetical protein